MEFRKGRLSWRITASFAADIEWNAANCRIVYAVRCVPFDRLNTGWAETETTLFRRISRNGPCEWTVVGPIFPVMKWQPIAPWSPLIDLLPRRVISTRRPPLLLTIGFVTFSHCSPLRVEGERYIEFGRIGTRKLAKFLPLARKRSETSWWRNISGTDCTRAV